MKILLFESRFLSTLVASILAGFLLALPSDAGEPIFQEIHISEASETSLSVGGRDAVTVHPGGEMSHITATGQSQVTVLPGTNVSRVTASDEASVYISGGMVWWMRFHAGTTGRVTSSKFAWLLVSDEADVHVYGSDMEYSNGHLRGTGTNGMPFEYWALRLTESGGIDTDNRDSLPSGITLHDITVEGSIGPVTAPVSHYKLDETDGTILRDYTNIFHRSANGIYESQTNGIVNLGSPPLANPDTHPGTSVRFGNGGRARVPGTALPQLNGGSAISLWVDVDLPQHKSLETIISKSTETGSHGSFALCVNSTGQLEFLSGDRICITEAPITANKRHHIVASWHGVGLNRTVDLYVDGMKAGSGNGDWTLDTSTYDLLVGGASMGGSGLNGTIDDIQVYAKALSPREVATLFAYPGKQLTDADYDNLPDAYEFACFGTMKQNGSGDFDGDGRLDIDEFIAGTDPTDIWDHFQVSNLSHQSKAGLELTWKSAPGRFYRVLHSTDLSDWKPLTDWMQADPEATGPMSQTHPKSKDGRGYYKVSSRLGE